MSQKKRNIVTEDTVISKTYFVYTKHNMNFGDATGHYGIVKVNHICIINTANS
jgi:hypothetical protein